VLAASRLDEELVDCVLPHVGARPRGEREVDLLGRLEAAMRAE
jgi:hypothetical protein